MVYNKYLVLFNMGVYHHFFQLTVYCDYKTYYGIEDRRTDR
jgi:hypothetical protein